MICPMRLRRLVLLALILPGLLLGPGWDLRVCMQNVLNSACCRTVELSSSCCDSESQSARQPEEAFGRECDECCVHIATPAEKYVANQSQCADQVERSQVAALSVSIQAIDALAPRPAAERWTLDSTGCPPTTPGRCTPLPLRI